MRLGVDTALRADAMVTHCGLDSASIFFCDRRDAVPRLSYLYHRGVSEEAQHIYKDQRVFEDDPFTHIIDRTDRCGQLIRWGDRRLLGVAGEAVGYRAFLDHYSVDVVGAYVQQVLSGLFLVFGVHCRPGAHRKTEVAHGLLSHEIGAISQMVVTQLLAETVSASGGRDLLGQVLDGDTAAAVGPPGPTLSRRERQVAELVSTGQQNKQVAYAIGLSEFTVENHLRRIYRKLGVHNRAGMAAELFRRSIQ